MIAGEVDPLPDAARNADVVIVGAGAVGILMAVDLARRGLGVTLLEAGPREPAADYRDHNAGPQTGRAHLGLIEGRMKALGGTTRLWGGQLVPFTRADLELASFPGQPRWPLDHAAYRGWVDAVFDLLGIAPAARDPAAAWHRATGQPAAFGSAFEVGMNLWLPQPDFARVFARELAAPGTLTVVCGAEVERLEFGTRGCVRAVHTPRGAFRAPSVVLACGTIEIARLLLRAAATEPDCGFAGNPHLGRWFMDHLHGLIGEVEVLDPERIGELFDYVHHGGLRFGVKLRLADEARAAQGLGNGVATINPRLGLRQGLAELAALLRRLSRGHGSLAETVRHLVVMARITLPLAWRYLVRRRSALAFSTGVAVGVEFEQVPSAESRVFLDPAEPAQSARAGLCWQPTGAEMRTVQAIGQAVQQVFAERGLGMVRLDPRVVEGDPGFLDDCHDAYHQMGGARIGADEGEGVVDGDLRVFGTGNLFVAGAAVFPSGSFANPTLTALALGLRLADHLARGAGREATA